MQDTNRQHSAARRAAAGLIMGLALVAGIASAAQAEPPTVRRGSTRDVSAQSADYTSYATVGDNGDGTAFVYAYVELGDGTHIDVYDPAATVFSVTNDLRRGQSMSGSFSGAANAIVAGDHHDPVTDVRIPVTVTIVIGVTNATDLGAWMQQGMNFYKDPGTGDVNAYRQHFKGKQAYGQTCGALSVAMDGVIVLDSTSSFGAVGSYDNHSIERIN